jgi:phosphonate transport system substrate-binding protein
MSPAVKTLLRHAKLLGSCALLLGAALGCSRQAAEKSAANSGSAPVVAAPAPLSTPTPAAPALAQIVVALKPDKNPEILKDEQTALAAYLGDRLAIPVSTKIPLTAGAILEGFANGTIDLGYLSATDIVQARARGVATLLLAAEYPDGRTAYDSYWVVKKDTPYQSIADLRGRPVAFASRTSTSGFVIPLADLEARGLLPADADPVGFFGPGNVFYGVGYVSAIERVLAGEAEAAAVSYYVLDQDKHLTLEQRASLRMLQKQGPVPSHVLAVRTSLSPAQTEALRAALLGLNEPAWQPLRDKLFSTKLVVTDADSHLASLDAALALARRALKQ